MTNEAANEVVEEQIIGKNYSVIVGWVTVYGLLVLYHYLVDCLFPQRFESQTFSLSQKTLLAVTETLVSVGALNAENVAEFVKYSRAVRDSQLARNNHPCEMHWCPIRLLSSHTHTHSLSSTILPPSPFSMSNSWIKSAQSEIINHLPPELSTLTGKYLRPPIIFDLFNDDLEQYLLINLKNSYVGEVAFEVFCDNRPLLFSCPLNVWGGGNERQIHLLQMIHLKFYHCTLILRGSRITAQTIIQSQAVIVSDTRN